MKRLAAVALIAAGVVIPAFAQRPASGAGAAVHSAPAFHGGSGGSASRFSGSGPRFSGSGPRNIGSAPRFSGSAPRFNGPAPALGNPRRFTGAPPRYNPGRSIIPAHTFPRGDPGGAGEHRNNGHTGDPDSHQRRRPYEHDHRDGYSYDRYGVTGSVGWVSPFVLGYGDSMDYNGDAQGTEDNAGAGSGQENGTGYGQGYGDENGPPPPDQGPQQALPPWPSSDPSHVETTPAPQMQAPEPQPQEAVTLVFKDGRPPEQIHNYLLTGTTLYVQDQHHRDIPLSQLDLIATAKANHEAGVDFRLPDAPK